MLTAVEYDGGKKLNFPYRCSIGQWEKVDLYFRCSIVQRKKVELYLLLLNWTAGKS